MSLWLCGPSPAQARKLVFTSADRAVSYYDANRGSYELAGRVYASGNMGVPQSLTLVTNESGVCCMCVCLCMCACANVRVRM